MLELSVQRLAWWWGRGLSCKLKTLETTDKLCRYPLSRLRAQSLSDVKAISIIDWHFLQINLFSQSTGPVHADSLFDIFDKCSGVFCTAKAERFTTKLATGASIQRSTIKLLLMSQRGIGVRSILVRWDRYSPKFGPGQANSDFQIFQIFALSCCHSLGRHGPVFRAISCSSKKRTKAREKTINICLEIMSSTFIGNKKNIYIYIDISIIETGSKMTWHKILHYPTANFRYYQGFCSCSFARTFCDLLRLQWT